MPEGLKIRGWYQLIIMGRNPSIHMIRLFGSVAVYGSYRIVLNVVAARISRKSGLVCKS